MGDVSQPGLDTDHKWTWARIYYFEDKKDNLILDGIWPSLHAACEGHRWRTAYFQRDWTGGPNILVGLKACCHQDNPAAFMSSIGEYIGAHPSMSVITDEQYAERARHLSAMENSTAEPLQRNNSVVLVNEPMVKLLRDEELKVTVRNYLAQSSNICIGWLKGIRDGFIDRNQLMVQLLVAVVWVVNPEKLIPYLSLRSHAEGFLCTEYSEGRDTRSKFKHDYYGDRGTAVREVVDRTLRSLDSGNEIVPGVKVMLDLFRGTLMEFYEGVANKRYKLEPLWNRSLDDSPAVRSWQMMISLVYRSFNQLGITATERFLACYLVGRAMEDYRGRNRTPPWDWEAGPVDLSVYKREEIERSFPYFFQNRSR